MLVPSGSRIVGTNTSLLAVHDALPPRGLGRARDSPAASREMKQKAVVYLLERLHRKEHGKERVKCTRSGRLEAYCTGNLLLGRNSHGPSPREKYQPQVPYSSRQSTWADQAYDVWVQKRITSYCCAPTRSRMVGCWAATLLLLYGHTGYGSPASSPRHLQKMAKPLA